MALRAPRPTARSGPLEGSVYLWASVLHGEALGVGFEIIGAEAEEERRAGVPS